MCALQLFVHTWSRPMMEHRSFARCTCAHLSFSLSLVSLCVRVATSRAVVRRSVVRVVALSWRSRFAARPCTCVVVSFASCAVLCRFHVHLLACMYVYMSCSHALCCCSRCSCRHGHGHGHGGPQRDMYTEQETHTWTRTTNHTHVRDAQHACARWRHQSTNNSDNRRLA